MCNYGCVRFDAYNKRNPRALCGAADDPPFFSLQALVITRATPLGM